MKNCSNQLCNQENPQPLERFYKNPSNKDGLSFRCSDCSKGDQRKWRNNHPGGETAKNRRYRERHPERRLDTALKRYYGISLEDKKAILSAQGGTCGNPGCGKVLDVMDRHTCVDHCHTTGKVRGVLCRNCNVSLGQLEESAVRILGLVDYLRATSK